MSMCASVYAFSNSAEQMFAPLYILRSSDKRCKGRSCKMHPLCIKLDKQSVEWMPLLSTVEDVWYHPFSLFWNILWPLQLFHLLYFLNRSLCLSGYNQPAWFPVRQPFPPLDHFHVTSLPSTYWYTSTTRMAASSLLILWYGYSPIFKSDLVV